MLKTITILICSFFLTGCQTFYCGINKTDIKNMTLQDAGWVVAGVIASSAVHEGAHVLACEIIGTDYKLKKGGSGIIIAYNGDGLSNADHRWIARAGLLSQNITGLFLNDAYFSKGFKLMSAVTTWTYPLRKIGDLDEIDKHGGNAMAEWGLYSLIAGYNLIRIEW